MLAAICIAWLLSAGSASAEAPEAEALWDVEPETITFDTPPEDWPLDYQKIAADSIVLPLSDGKKRNGRGRAVNADGEPERFRAFVEIFQLFIDYVNDFSREKDKIYATIGDFRMKFIQQLSERYPNAFIQADAYRISSTTESTHSRAYGGGVGIRIDRQPLKGGLLSLFLMPLYGESRSYMLRDPVVPLGSDFIFRMNVGASYEHRFENAVDAGGEVFFQPQVFDGETFRVFTETYVRFKIINRTAGRGKYFRVEQVSVVPKVVYWKTLGRPGLDTAVLDALSPQYLHQFGESLYGFCNLEFRFRM